MKKSFLHTLSLAIIAMMSISACAPAKVSKEEGLKAFEGIKLAYEQEKVAPPRVFSFDYHESFSRGENSTDSREENIKIEIDLDKGNSYVSLFSVLNNEVIEKSETWTFYEDGHVNFLIDSMQIRKARRVEEIPLEALQDLIINDSSETQEAIAMITSGAIYFAESTIDISEIYGEEHIHDYVEGKADCSSSTTYRSNGEGSFGLDFYSTIKDCINPLTDKEVDMNEKSNVEIDNYYLTKSYVREEIYTYSSKQTMVFESSINVSYKSNFSHPNLNDFVLID